jgi:hypothetical protein
MMRIAASLVLSGKSATKAQLLCKNFPAQSLHITINNALAKVWAMRRTTLSLALSFFTLAACGGDSPQSGETDESSGDSEESSDESSSESESGDSEGSSDESSMSDGTDSEDDDDDDSSVSDESESDDEESSDSDDDDDSSSENSETDEDSETSSEDESDSDSETDDTDGDLARGNIKISQVLANQAVPFPIIVDGEVVSESNRNFPVIGTRRTLFQAFWEIPDDWKSRDIKAVLTLEQKDATQKEYEVTTNVAGESKEGTLTGAFSWTVEPEDLQDETKILITLWEVDDSNTDIPESDEPPQTPSAGLSDLGVDNAKRVYRQVIVPVTYSKGSCNTDMRKALTPEVIEDFRNYIYARVPVQDVEITIHEESFSYSGDAWDDILSELQSRRNNDGADPDVYYYAPIDACSGNIQGFGGYSYIPAAPTKNNASDRVSSGLWRGGDDFTHVTFVHESGHAQGRYHAPCGPAAGIDSNYPKDTAHGQEAGIGVWGYDTYGKEFKDPLESKDYMSYCYTGSFISDYGWEIQLETATALGSWSYFSTQPDEFGPEVLRIRIDENGQALRWWTTNGGLAGRTRNSDAAVTYYQRGKKLGTFEGAVQPSPHDDTVLLYAPVPTAIADADAVSITLHGKTQRVALNNLRRYIRRN